MKGRHSSIASVQSICIDQQYRKIVEFSFAGAFNPACDFAENLGSGLSVQEEATMNSFSGKLALSVAGVALLTMAAHAQTPNGAVQPSHQAAVHHRVHHAYPAYDRHAYHTGTAYHAAAIYNQAAPYSGPYEASGAIGAAAEEQPLYNAAAEPVLDQYGVVCLGGVGVGYYPNPIAYDQSAYTYQAGGEFTLDRGYPGCFTHVGE
jgi:hypothetical protein